MIANEIAFGESFQANIHYNLYGNKAEPNPHKCAWHVSKNMFTDDLDAAGKIMEATASASRASKPAYHFSIDWDRSEERFLNQEKCIEAADKVLEKIGLAEHQALYFWHVDANHPHMHVVVNRVSDHTGKAWDMWKSKENLERATHEVAKEMQFLEVPGKHNEMGYERDKNKDANRSRSERATEAELKPWSKEKIPGIKTKIGNAFYHSESWDELADTLADFGYELRTKGQGLIITDGHNYTQLSKMGKQVRLKSLEEKFGETFAEHTGKNPLNPVDEHSPETSLEELPDEIDRELKRQVDRLEKQQTQNQDIEGRGSTDIRVIQLINVLDNIDRFEGLWNQKQTAAEMMMADKKVKQQHSLLEKAKGLLEIHKQAGIDLIFSSYKKPVEDKSLNTVKKIDEALKNIGKYRPKKSGIATPKTILKQRRTEHLIKVLKWRRKKIEKEQRRAKRHNKERKRELKAKNKQQFDRKQIYRICKLREASDRVTKRKIELSDAQTKLRQSVKANERNIATKQHLKDCRRSLIRNMPKEAIMNADVSWEEKKRLFNVWYAERDLERAKERDRQFEQDRDIELDD
ncbi:relaxase/mobilization nuclease domain-containing protein [Kordiimonas sp. SCSIO 12603]|uniref:relaxase/mobilization nuclease domain-containing protein n=1 Tax=Kordiimonas sp. SCSIO 12603 TaxID=2829596 RepID=UPI002103A340|nr:relaxase/mobilization nuclease domain-containing protein [Kordiimonas sp. SCSIO 12603]UTW58849.1 relaxase/mobilization nuclease domain-containing protein [Kordiimonas sp. SCSIO 12603]